MLATPERSPPAGRQPPLDKHLRGTGWSLALAAAVGMLAVQILAGVAPWPAARFSEFLYASLTVLALRGLLGVIAEALTVGRPQRDGLLRCVWPRKHLHPWSDVSRLIQQDDDEALALLNGQPIRLTADRTGPSAPSARTLWRRGLVGSGRRSIALDRPFYLNAGWWMAGGFFALLAVPVVLAPLSRRGGTAQQWLELATLFAAGLGAVLLALHLRSQRILCTREGLENVSRLRRRRLAWEQVDAVRLRINPRRDVGWLSVQFGPARLSIRSDARTIAMLSRYTMLRCPHAHLNVRD